MWGLLVCMCARACLHVCCSMHAYVSLCVCGGELMGACELSGCGWVCVCVYVCMCARACMCT